MPYSQILWRGHFLHWDSCLSDDSILCQAAIKLASTVLMEVEPCCTLMIVIWLKLLSLNLLVKCCLLLSRNQSLEMRFLNGQWANQVWFRMRIINYKLIGEGRHHKVPLNHFSFLRIHDLLLFFKVILLHHSYYICL